MSLVMHFARQAIPDTRFGIPLAARLKFKERGTRKKDGKKGSCKSNRITALRSFNANRWLIETISHSVRKLSSGIQTMMVYGILCLEVGLSAKVERNYPFSVVCFQILVSKS